MTREEIERLSRDQLLETMRCENLDITHSLYASIHDTPEEMDRISATLTDSDVPRWRRELVAHFAQKGSA